MAIDYQVRCAEYERRIDELQAAILEDIRGAGPMTGPIYHKAIRRVMNIPAEGDGRDVVRNDERAEP